MSTASAATVHARGGWALVALLSVAASIARTVLDGQDLNFDLVTYHYYLGYSAFSDRTALDFLPASFQGYQSPLPYMLLYWLDSINTPPVINAATHATLHALNLIVLYFLAGLLLEGTAQARSRIALLSLWLMGAITPVYWLVVGTSFADLLMSVLVLSGLWLAALALESRAREEAVAWRTLAAGAVCLGAATGMRVHNAIYVVTLLGALAVAAPGTRKKIYAVGLFALTSAAGGLACFAPWAWRIYREFGNPVFPFFNAVFRSPDFPAANLPLTNFVPHTLGGFAALPFRIGTLTDWVYVESRLPDVRPGLLVASAAALVLLGAYRRYVIRVSRNELSPRPARRLILAFFLFGAIVWLATSCNGRYGVALFLLAGPVCAALLYRLLPMRYVLLAVGLTVAWQAAVQQVFFGLPRWGSDPWGARYFDWDLPESVRREPALFLSFGVQTASTLAPRTHPASRHANLVGQYSLSIDQPGAERMHRMIDSAGGRIYGLFDLYYTQQNEPASRSIKAYFADQLRPWRLDFKESLCWQIELKRAEGWDWLNRMAGIEYRGRRPGLLLCELRHSAAEDRERAIRELRAFQAKLAPLAAACPRFFAKPVTILREGDAWFAMSLVSFEYRLEFYDGAAFELQQQRSPYVSLRLGEVTPKAIIPQNADCAHWFDELEARSTEVLRR